MAFISGGQFIIKLRIVFLTLFVLVAIPLVILVTLPVLIFRRVGQFLVKNLYWDAENILKIVDPTSQLIAHDHLKPNPRFNVIYCWVGEGELSITTLRQLFHTNILERNVIKRGRQQLVFPELKCEAVRIGGYDYWKKISNFRINDYVKLYKEENEKCEAIMNDKADKITTEKDLKDIVAHLVTKGWNRGQSPWECLLINNYVNEENQSVSKSVVLLRIHHFLADGYSIMQILRNIGDSPPVNVPVKNIKPVTRKTPGQINIQQLLLQLVNLFLFPYQIALILDQISRRELNSWKVSPDKRSKIGQKVYQTWSGLIPIETVKTIKNRFGTSFSDVINSVVAGAIQNLMKRVKQDVPDMITAVSLALLKQHPDCLTNYFGHQIDRLPTGEFEPRKRLRLTAEESKRMKSINSPSLTYLLFYLLGLYPPFLTKSGFSVDVGYSLGLSVFTTFDIILSWGNCKHVEGFYTLGTGVGNTGALISVLSQLENIKFVLSIDQQVYPSERELEKFNEIIQAEISTLLAE